MTNPYETELSLEDVMLATRVKNALAYLRIGAMKEKSGETEASAAVSGTTREEVAGFELRARQCINHLPKTQVR